MVNFNNIDNRLPVTPTQSSPEQKGNRAAASETVKSRTKVYVERRRKRDRRDTRRGDKAAFNRRTGPDRRRGSLDIEV